MARPQRATLEPVLHNYPRFYQPLKDRGLLDTDVFQGAGEVEDASLPALPPRRTR